jgi:transposase
MRKVSKNVESAKVETGAGARVVAVGLDLGDQWSHWCGLDAQGEVAARGRVRTTLEAMAEQAGGWVGVRVAIENGTHSGWVSRALGNAGCEVVVANPSRWRGTAHSSKNDRNDAEALARVVRVDPRLLFPIVHRPAAQQSDLAVVRVRAQLVKVRTQLVNTARGVVKSLGSRLPAADAAHFGKTWAAVPAVLQAALEPLYRTLGAVTAQIEALDKQVAALSKECYPETERLRSVPGVGPVTALCYVLTLGDPARFRRSRDAGAYLGLRPKQRQSGSRDPELGIAKNGDSYLRSLLVECAHHVLSRGPDSALKQWGLRLADGGKGVKKRALVAVARKLAVLLHRLWTSGDRFQPFPEETVDAEPRAHRSLGTAATTAVA